MLLVSTVDENKFFSQINLTPKSLYLSSQTFIHIDQREMVHKKDKLPINNLHLQKIGGKLTRTRKNTKYSFFFKEKK